ncbi:MAG: polysaccharide deacetylase family protein [Patescibacteria group bacterium]|nr:polysaccharide deacetylase family protein [Patescibacteria group bacterium]
MKFSKKQYAIIGVLFVLGAFLVYQLFGSLRLGYVKSTYLSPKAVAAEKTVSTRPLITFFIPTPTPTPTPTPVYTGYCLNVPVLMYHHTAPWEIAKTKGYTSLDVDNGVFDLQMGYLASHGYNTIFAEDLVNALRNHSSLPQKSIVVSLDDGYDDVYNYAFPVARKYGIKLTVFVPTGLLGNTSPTNSYYTWGQLQDMLNSGLVSVGNHTWSHFPMGTKDTAKDQYEVSTAQKELQQYVGKNPITFAYPYGTNAGLSRLYPILAQNGIVGAFSTWGGTVQCDSFMYSLHRTRIGNVPFPAFGIY